MSSRILATLAFAALSAACAGVRSYTEWPYVPPLMMVRNPTAHPLLILARDGAGRELVAARLRPKSRQCFRWPFIHAIGYLVSTDADGSPADSVTTGAFRPWTADGWEWAGQVEPVSNANACR
jgi:hypothetical protein